jgi:hypothetical protein
MTTTIVFLPGGIQTQIDAAFVSFDLNDMEIRFYKSDADYKISPDLCFAMFRGVIGYIQQENK